MPQPRGYAVMTSPDATKEYDTLTCAHCNRVVLLKPGADLGGFCRHCMKGVCGPCADQGNCTPFEKKLEAYERRMRLRQAIGGG